MLFASFLALLQLYFPVEPVASHRHPLESFKRSVETAVRNDFSTVLQHCHEMVLREAQQRERQCAQNVCPVVTPGQILLSCLLKERAFLFTC
eukprot:5156435-Amphidinium_carterae.1